MSTLSTPRVRKIKAVRRGSSSSTLSSPGSVGEVSQDRGNSNAWQDSPKLSDSDGSEEGTTPSKQKISVNVTTSGKLGSSGGRNRRKGLFDALEDVDPKPSQSQKTKQRKNKSKGQDKSADDDESDVLQDNAAKQELMRMLFPVLHDEWLSNDTDQDHQADQPARKWSASSLDTPLYDEFGFVRGSNGSSYSYDGTLSKKQKAAKEKKLLKLQEEWMEIYDNFPSWKLDNPKKLKNKVREGIPAMMRSVIWPLLADVESLKEENKGLFENLLAQSCDDQADEQIWKDIPRTFPNHEMFQQERSNAESSTSSLYATDGRGLAFADNAGQSALYNVLRAYATYDAEVGYCQGMSFVVGVLLMFVNEEDAFFMLIQMMEKYHLRGLYLPGMASLKMYLSAFDDFLKEEVRPLAAHFEEIGIASVLYASQWFMTLFSYNWPFDITLRVFDCFLNEGIKVVFRIGIAVLKLQGKRLSRMAFDELILEFSGLPMVYGGTKGIDQLFKCAFGLKITRKQLAAFNEKFEAMEEKNRKKQEEDREKYYKEKEEKEKKKEEKE